MLFFREKEAMGLEASLRLLDVPSNATIDDANQAYANLHRMIDLFHRDNGTADHAGRQADMELLTCAYEKAVSHLSDQDSRRSPEVLAALRGASAGATPAVTDLHFTINFPADADGDASDQDPPNLPEPNGQTVQAAVSITSRRLNEAESALQGARQAVESAKAAVAAANRQHETAKLARIHAVVAAKSARTQALLLEIEANRAMDEAIAIAKKARDRVLAARQTAREARSQADHAREQVGQVGQSEETAAAEVICAEEVLEKAKARLKTLSHTVVESRRRLKFFQEYGTVAADEPGSIGRHAPISTSSEQPAPRNAVDRHTATREQILSDLQEIETSLNTRQSAPSKMVSDETGVLARADRDLDRRQHARITYPEDQRPAFSVDGRSIPIHDLSSVGVGLAADVSSARSRLVRGTIAFEGRAPLNVTGRVVRQDEQGVGLRLVTRIGNHVLDRERLRLSA